MTSSQVVNMVRLLVDESRIFYFDNLTEAINEAQLKIIKKGYQSGDERMLRPLYVNELIPISGSYTTNKVLYPRSLRMTMAGTNEFSDSYSATYLDYGKFSQTTYPDGDMGMLYPRTAYYTVVDELDGGTLKSKVLYTDIIGAENAYAKFWFIKYPPGFVYDYSNLLTQQNLSLPQEYHIQVCTLAAEIMNDIDVGEIERGDIAFQNQRLTIKGLAID